MPSPARACAAGSARAADGHGAQVDFVFEPAALDLSLMVPALTAGGVLLWRRAPWGYLLAALASIQGALYLLVLSVNSIIAIERRLATAPDELPIWGSLTVFTATVAFVLLANVRGTRGAHRRTAHHVR